MQKINELYLKSYRDLAAKINSKRQYSTLLVILTQHEPCNVNGGIEHCLRSDLKTALTGHKDVLLVLPFVSKQNKNSLSGFCVSLILNRDFLGIVLLDSLGLSFSGIEVSNVIYYSLIGFDLQSLSRFALSTKNKTMAILWLHDLSYACESQILIRDDIFCSLQTVDSLYCNGCEHQPGRLPLHKFYTRFIKQVDLLIFPSHIAKERFFNYFNLPSMGNIDYKILPHYQATSKKNIQLAGYTKDMPICFSFFGHNVAHKGWFKFLNLVDELELTGKFKFYHIGTAHFSDDRVEHISFSEVEHDDPVDELGRLCTNHNIRLGFFWSTTLESFGIMLRQVLATQCAVLARGDDPALKEFIDDCDKIVYFDQFEDLVNFAMDENAVHDLLNKAANTVCSLKESEYSFSVLNNNYKKTNP
jgi:hypothetical protein